MLLFTVVGKDSLLAWFSAGSRLFLTIFVVWCLPIGLAAIQKQNLFFLSPQLPRNDLHQLGEQPKERRLKNGTLFFIVAVVPPI